MGTTFKQYRTFWNKKLQELYENGDSNRKQANRAEEMEATIRDLQTRMANMATIHENYRNEEAQQFSAMLASRGTPAAVPASDTSTTLDLTQVSQLTTASLNNYIQQGVSTGINMGLASCGIGNDNSNSNSANNGNENTKHTSNRSNQSNHSN